MTRRVVAAGGREEVWCVLCLCVPLLPLCASVCLCVPLLPLCASVCLCVPLCASVALVRLLAAVGAWAWRADGQVGGATRGLSLGRKRSRPA